VGEVDRGDVGAMPAKVGSEQGEVVVLHQHDGVVGSLVGHNLGEGAVVGLIGLPGVVPASVDDRTPAEVVETVVQEPQRGIADGVVGLAKDRRFDLESSHPQIFGLDHSLGSGDSVAIAQRRRDPGGVGAGNERSQP